MGSIDECITHFCRRQAWLGLFKAMAGAGTLTPEELAEKTATHPRIIKEWLATQAAGGFVTYNPATGTYALPDEQAFA
jgi:DNA-binding IclR family transcriptional regulator